MDRRIRQTCWLLLAALLSVWSAAPLDAAAKKGRISGSVDKPKQVKAVFAKDRLSEEKDRIYQGKFNAKTGRFAIEGLPLNATYDVIIDHDNGRLEGVNLKVPPSDFEEEQPLTKEDAAGLKKVFLEQNKFDDKFEFLTIQGNVQHAALLVSSLRIKPFYESKPGEVIWRLALWHFEKPEDIWIKDQDELFIVHYRERILKKDFDKKALTLDSKLGGHRLTAKGPELKLGEIKLPPKGPGIRFRPDKGAPKGSGKAR